MQNGIVALMLLKNYINSGEREIGYPFIPTHPLTHSLTHSLNLHLWVCKMLQNISMSNITNKCVSAENEAFTSHESITI